MDFRTNQLKAFTQYLFALHRGSEREIETISLDVHFAFENFSLKTETEIPRKTTCKCYKSKRQKPFAEYHFHI